MLAGSHGVWVDFLVRDMALRGRILRFDQVRGYGFIAPSNGGEDVFVHANDLYDDKYALSPGTLVEFDVEEGERGLKASAVKIVENGPPPRRPIASGVLEGTRVDRSGDEDAMCDVLGVSEFLRETTEILLEAAPTLTAGQILQLRQHLLKQAQRHQWIED
jgi:CspA family cold shock protein